MIRRTHIQGKANRDSSLISRQGQLAPRSFSAPEPSWDKPATRATERAPCCMSFEDIDIMPRTVVQPKLALGPVDSNFEGADHAQRESLSDLDRTPEERKDAPPNRTGMPDRLKWGIESLSGLDLSGVRVHYHSPKPAQINAFAYTQGREIHVASGQERHLPHEAWHIVQQALRRVRPTMQLKGRVAVNDDKGLEREAEVMGAEAAAEASFRSVAHGFRHPSDDSGVAKRTESVEFEVPSSAVGVSGEKVRLNLRTIGHDVSKKRVHTRSPEMTAPARLAYTASLRPSVGQIIQRKIMQGGRPGDIIRSKRNFYYKIVGLKVGKQLWYKISDANGHVTLVTSEDEQYYLDSTTDESQLKRVVISETLTPWVKTDDKDYLKPEQSAIVADSPSDPKIPLPPPFPPKLKKRVPTEDELWALYKVPLKNPMKTGAKYDFAWWFDYFYNEISPSPRKMYYLKQSHEIREQNEGKSDPTLVPKNLEDDRKRQLLTDMMNEGHADFIDKRAGNELLSNPLSLPKMMGEKIRQQDIGFRGEQREPDEAKKHGGTKPKAQVPELRENLNMTKTWHPFSVEEQARRPLFRLESTDNDLHTVISIAKTFEDATKFPLIDEEETEAHINSAFNKLVSWNWIYVIVVDTAYDTGKAQELFRGTSFSQGELAVTDLGWDKLLAVAHVMRIHNLDHEKQPVRDANMGHDFYVESWKFLQNDAAIELALGASGKKKLESFLESKKSGSYKP